MSFRKRNIGITDGRRPQETTFHPAARSVQLPGVRPSTADGRLVTSTGSANFDTLFAGHGGIPLGSSILIEESGTTDYAGALLRFYAAEGLVQGHYVHVVALPDSWGRELPGLATETSRKSKEALQDEKMKIAWRYERLGRHGSDAVVRERMASNPEDVSHAQDADSAIAFCHTFDLSKRLVHPPAAQLRFLTIDPSPGRKCFGRLVTELTNVLTAAPVDSVHRLIVPSLLSPALYPTHSSLPSQVLMFQHDLRRLLSAFPRRFTVVQTLPLSLHPRSSGLTKWIEMLSDGIYDLTPFPHSSDAEFQTARDPSTKEEPPQGLLRVHKVPILHEMGAGTPLADTDWTFTLSRRKFVIKPFDLPPIEGDTEAQQDVAGDKKPKKAEIAF